MSAFLARVAGATPGACASAPFSDVATNHPFCKEIQWMKDNGISTGFDDGTYRPSNNVTRQAMSAFLYRVSFLVQNVATAQSIPARPRGVRASKARPMKALPASDAIVDQLSGATVDAASAALARRPRPGSCRARVSSRTN
jgi:hypothetical protein